MTLDGEEILRQIGESVAADPELPDLTPSITGQLNINSVPLAEFLSNRPRGRDRTRSCSPAHDLYRQLGGDQ